METKALTAKEMFIPKVANYAEYLIAFGFTVYANPKHVTVNGDPIPVAWFHYSKDGFYGTFGISDFDGPKHTMPIKPSQAYGSSILVAEAEAIDPYTLDAARIIARERNKGVYVGTGFHKNNEPWGIGNYYQEVTA